MLHYIHAVDINNVGDMFCGYYKYFYNDLKKYNLMIHDISYPDFNKIYKDDTIIFGGGGMIDASNFWNNNINTILDKSKNIIFWSLGHNKHYNQNINVKINFDKVNMLSIRDYNHESGFRYVPCASCMIPYLKMKEDIKREIGIISHKDYIIENNKYDIITNSQNIYEIIDFIRTSKVIITNSYHATYWATLMKRKVITMGYLHSNKFNYLKYPPKEYTGNIIKDINDSKIYELALNESIDLTLNYFNEIKNYLKETQSNLFNISYDLTEKYYNDFQAYETFNYYINDMYDDLNNKYNKITLILEKLINSIAWFIPIRKWRDNFRNKILNGQDRTGQDRTGQDRTGQDTCNV